MQVNFKMYIENLKSFLFKFYSLFRLLTMLIGHCLLTNFVFVFLVMRLDTWVQNSERMYTCPNNNCQRNYKTKPGLYNHLKYECNIPPKYHCNICNKKFKQPGNFKIHMKSLHLVTLIKI